MSRSTILLLVSATAASFRPESFAEDVTCLLKKATAVRVTPSPTAEGLATAPAGLSLQVQATADGWARVTSTGTAYGAFILTAACDRPIPGSPPVTMAPSRTVTEVRSALSSAVVTSAAKSVGVPAQPTALEPVALEGSVTNTTSAKQPMSAAVLITFDQRGSCVLRVSAPLYGSGVCRLDQFDEKTGQF